MIRLILIAALGCCGCNQTQPQGWPNAVAQAAPQWPHNVKTPRPSGALADWIPQPQPVGMRPPVAAGSASSVVEHPTYNRLDGGSIPSRTFSDSTLVPVRAPKPLLILFTAPKCAPCVIAKRTLAECESEIIAAFDFREVDILAEPEYGVRAAPFLVVYDQRTSEAVSTLLTPPTTADGMRALLGRYAK